MPGPVLGAVHTDLNQARGYHQEGRLSATGRGTLEGFPEEVRIELRFEELGGGSACQAGAAACSRTGGHEINNTA